MICESCGSEMVLIRDVGYKRYWYKCPDCGFDKITKQGAGD